MRRHPGADQRGVDVGEHRAQQRSGRPDLHLLQQVDPDRAVVPLLGQGHLDVDAQDAEPHGVQTLVQVQLRDRPVGLPRFETVGTVEALQGGVDEVLVGVAAHHPPHVAARVAVLQHPRHHQVWPDAGDDAEPARLRDRAGESPVRDGDTHAALDDRRETVCSAHDE